MQPSRKGGLKSHWRSVGNGIGIATRNKKLLAAPGRTTGSKDATRGSWHMQVNQMMNPATLSERKHMADRKRGTMWNEDFTAPRR